MITVWSSLPENIIKLISCSCSVICSFNGSDLCGEQSLQLWGSRIICLTTHCTCCKRRLNHFGTTSARQGCSDLTPFPTPCSKILRMQKLRAPPPWWQPRAIEGFLLLSLLSVVLVVCQLHLALHDVLVIQGFLFYLSSFCLPGSFNFIVPKFLQSLTMECVWSIVNRNVSLW